MSSGTGSRPGYWRTACTCSRRSCLTSAGPRKRPQPAAAPWLWSGELDYPFGQAGAATCLSIAASYTGDPDQALRLIRQAGQIPDIPGTAARICGYLLAIYLAEAGDLAAAGQACAATLARARDAGDLYNLGELLWVMADLDLQADRVSDAAAHLREAVQISLPTGMWFTILNVLEVCGDLCAAAGRFADAITAWGAADTFGEQGGFAPQDSRMCRRKGPLQRPGRHSARTGPAPPSSVARR